jgi:hypothetical protein
MLNLRETTPGMVSSIRVALLDAWYAAVDPRAKGILKILLREIKPGVRYGTVGWVTEVVVEEAATARERGCGDLADKLYCASDALYDVLNDLSKGV